MCEASRRGRCGDCNTVSSTKALRRKDTATANNHLAVRISKQGNSLFWCHDYITIAYICNRQCFKRPCIGISQTQTIKRVRPHIGLKLNAILKLKENTRCLLSEFMNLFITLSHLHYAIIKVILKSEITFSQSNAIEIAITKKVI